MNVVIDALWIISYATLLFFIVYAIASLTLIVISAVEAAMQKTQRGKLFVPTRRALSPGVTIVAPAHDEEPVIVSSVRSLLACDYSPLEVLIVDDGSNDGTAQTMIGAFGLVELPVGDRFGLDTAAVEKLYVSRLDPRLRLVCKRHGGRSDAVNAGVNLARHELVAIVDADSLLERDALARIVDIFAADPERVIAVGGTVRIANGGLIESGRMVKAQVPVRGTEASQVCEYLRAFLGARIAWAKLNGLLIISGAFGVFRRDVLRAVGGLSPTTLGEDMELVMRLHEQVRPVRPDARVEYAADANCWTEAPSGLEPLRGQRIRWHVGLLDNLRLHRRLLGRRKFGAVGLAAMPYAVLFEVVAPFLQIGGYFVLALLILLDEVLWEYALSFFLITLLLGQLQTAGAILIEEVGFRRYRTRDLMLIGVWSLLEIWWYRPLTAWWRVKATVLVLFDRRPGWGAIPRGRALAAAPVEADGLEPAPLTR